MLGEYICIHSGTTGHCTRLIMTLEFDSMREAVELKGEFLHKDMIW